MALAEAHELTNNARKTVAADDIPLAAKVQHVEAERPGTTYAKLVELYYDLYLSKAAVAEWQHSKLFARRFEYRPRRVSCSRDAVMMDHGLERCWADCGGTK